MEFKTGKSGNHHQIGYDWFGIEQVICSQDTVDVQSKVIQSTKGSFARINVVYTDLTEYLAKTDAVNIGTEIW